MTRPPKLPSFFETSPSGDDLLTGLDRYEVEVTPWLQEAREAREACDAAIAAEISKPFKKREYFRLSEIADGLARSADLETPNFEESGYICCALIDRIKCGECVDDAGNPGAFTRADKPPPFEPCRPGVDGVVLVPAVAPEEIYISRAALHRFLRSSNLRERSRLLKDWFPIPKKPNRPTPEALDSWMQQNVRYGVKREVAIADCREATGAAVRAAKAAYGRLPADRKLGRGKKPPR